MKKLSFLLIIMFSLSTAAQAEEKINISTYHPSVKGIYKSLYVSERINFKGLIVNPTSGEIGQIIYRSDEDLFYYWKDGEGWMPLTGIDRTELSTVIKDTLNNLTEKVAWVETAGQTCQEKCQEINAVYCKEAWSCVTDKNFSPEYTICSGMLPFSQRSSTPITAPGIIYPLKCICMVE